MITVDGMSTNQEEHDMWLLTRDEEGVDDINKEPLDYIDKTFDKMFDESTPKDGQVVDLKDYKIAKENKEYGLKLEDKNLVKKAISWKKDIDKNLLFSENFAFIVEVSEENSSAFEDILNKCRCAYKQIGKTNKSNKIVVKNFIDLNINQTKKIWKNALRKKLQ